MRLLILSVAVSIVWILVIGGTLKIALATSHPLFRRLGVSSCFAGVSMAIWFLWHQVRFTVHPLDFVGHWKLVGLCVFGVVTSILSAILVPNVSARSRTAWIICALLFVGIFLLTAIVSIPVA